MTRTQDAPANAVVSNDVPASLSSPRVFWWLRVAMVAAVLAQICLMLFVPVEFAERYRLSTWFFCLPFVLASLACWMRSLRRGPDMVAWRLLAASLLSFVTGNLYAHFFTEYNESPTLADGFWLLHYLLAYIAIVHYTKAHLAEFHPSTWLDGGIAGLGTVALVVAFVLGPALAVIDAPWINIATNMAYPVADLIMILLLVTVGHALGGRDRSWQLLAAGFSTFMVADIFYLYQASNGTMETYSLVQSLWPIAVTLMGFAACVTSFARVRTSPAHRYLLPSLFVVASVALLVYGQWTELPLTAVVFSVLTLLLAGIRLAMTIREVRTLADSRAEARSDFLTGLPNRRSIAEDLADSLSRREVSTALLVIDLDRFSEINNSLGHLVGDQLLHEVGRRLNDARPPGSILGRLGGDEFAVVMPAAGVAQAIAAAERFTNVLEVPFGLIGLDIPVRASIGIATSPADATSETGLFAAADIAMYQAKRDGTGSAVFRVENDNPSRGRIQLLADLRSAVDQGQFILEYQPQLDIRTGRVVGVEALVRWNHPVRGLVQPDQFIPLLAQSSLMRTFTIGVLRQAAQTWADLRARGHELRMSVNITAGDLGYPALTEAIKELVAGLRIPPGSLVLEITENAVMVDRQRSMQSLRTFRDLGARISVDDYGTGQASLAYLRDLPLDEIKLDRSFLVGAPDDAHNAAIVRSTVELAHALELPIVAEGVEDRGTLEWLATLGCDMAQGYFISRPKPLNDVIALLDARAAAPTPADWSLA